MIKQVITVKKHFTHLSPYILFVLVMTFIMLYDFANDISHGIYIIYVCFGLISILNIYLHLEYLMLNLNVKLNIDKNKQVIFFLRKGKKDILISADNIKRVEIHQSYFYKSKRSLLTTDNYRFYKFILHNDISVVITSLILTEIDPNIYRDVIIKRDIVASVYYDCLKNRFRK